MHGGTLVAGEFQALVIDERNGKRTAAVRRVSERELPLGDVTVSVKYSSLNYKDEMVITGAADAAGSTGDQHLAVTRLEAVPSQEEKKTSP